MSRRSTQHAKKVYKYVHDTDEYIDTNITGIDYKHPDGWFSISPEGRITVHASQGSGYAWDGCSPKFQVLHLLPGTPDGKLDYFTEKPMTYYATLFHDALYQFKKESPLSRKAVDVIFCKILRESGYLWWWLYYVCVRAFGWVYGSWPNGKPVRGIRFIQCSWIVNAYKTYRELGKEELKNEPLIRRGAAYARAKTNT